MFGRPVKGHTIRHGSVIASAALDLVAGHWLRHVLGIKDTNERLQTLAMLCGLEDRKPVHAPPGTWVKTIPWPLTPLVLT